MKKPNIRMEKDENGFSIWLNNLWIIDASTFFEDYSISIDTKKLKGLRRKNNIVEYILKTREVNKLIKPSKKINELDSMLYSRNEPDHYKLVRENREKINKIIQAIPWWLEDRELR